MKGISDVVVCESKRLGDPAEFRKRAQTARLLLYALQGPIQTSVSKPQQWHHSAHP